MTDVTLKQTGTLILIVGIIMALIFAVPHIISFSKNGCFSGFMPHEGECLSLECVVLDVIQPCQEACQEKPSININNCMDSCNELPDNVADICKFNPFGV